MTSPKPPPKPRRRTKVWQEAAGDWRFEVKHPGGHAASGAQYPTELAARQAAKQVTFH